MTNESCFTHLNRADDRFFIFRMKNSLHSLYSLYSLSSIHSLSSLHLLQLFYLFYSLCSIHLLYFRSLFLLFTSLSSFTWFLLFPCSTGSFLHIPQLLLHLFCIHLLILHTLTVLQSAQDSYSSRHSVVTGIGKGGRGVDILEDLAGISQNPHRFLQFLCMYFGIRLQAPWLCHRSQWTWRSRHTEVTGTRKARNKIYDPTFIALFYN